ncbi:hypothetical protein, partial [Salmonella enterica]|uniref:hypothetical protein n=1 Tax=Salmonella enterica TaxID=28901 RepID=UPI0035251B61
PAVYCPYITSFTLFVVVRCHLFLTALVFSHFKLQGAAFFPALPHSEWVEAQIHFRTWCKKHAYAGAE